MNKKIIDLAIIIILIIVTTIFICVVSNTDEVQKYSQSTKKVGNFLGQNNNGQGNKISITENLAGALCTGHELKMESKNSIEGYTNENIVFDLDVSELEIMRDISSMEELSNAIIDEVGPTEAQSIIDVINTGMVAGYDSSPHLREFKLTLKDIQGNVKKEIDLANKIINNKISTQIEIEENCLIDLHAIIDIHLVLKDENDNSVAECGWERHAEGRAILEIYQIDKENPEITINPDGAEASNNIKVKIIAKDKGTSGLSPQNSYQYQLSTSNTAEPTGTWNQYTSGREFTIGEGLKGEYYLWVKTIEDQAGNKSSKDNYTVSEKFVFNNGESEKPIEIKDYTLDGTTIKNVQPNTTVDELKKHITINDTQNTKVLGKDGKEIQSTENITTGSKIQVKVNNETKEYKIVVTGDTDGDGVSNLNDILKINKHRLNKAKLENEYLLAGDVNKDNQVDLKDILQINKFRLGKIMTL